MERSGIISFKVLQPRGDGSKSSLEKPGIPLRQVGVTFTESVKVALELCRIAMITDGGGASLDVDEGIFSVTLHLLGSCLLCPSQSLSARALVGRMRVLVPEIRCIKVFSGEILLVSE